MKEDNEKCQQICFEEKRDLFFLFPDFLKNNILVEYDKKEH